MCDAASANQEKIREFFNHWHIYQTIIRENYMQHREIAAVLQQVLQMRYSDSDRTFSMLDLGCGDAYLSSQILQGLPVEYYCGVDLSDMPLRYAEQNMQSIPCEKNLVVNDLAQAVGNVPRPFDVILAGYSLHHLLNEEKAAFFHTCARALKPGGCFLLYDVISQENETRPAYLQRHWQAYSQWTQLTPEQLLIVKEHVFDKDYPESFSTLTQMALAGGFQRAEFLYSDAQQLFQACCFYH